MQDFVVVHQDIVLLRLLAKQLVGDVQLCGAYGISNFVLLWGFSLSRMGESSWVRLLRFLTGSGRFRWTRADPLTIVSNEPVMRKREHTNRGRESFAPAVLHRVVHQNGRNCSVVDNCNGRS